MNNKKHFKNVVVGVGISGAAIANKIVNELNEDVLIIDKRDHIGGNCFDYIDKDTNIYVHKYGTHIFHTDVKEVWDFISQYTKWYPYQHKVKGLIDGQEIPIPFNLNSIEKIFPKTIANRLEEKLINSFGFNVKVPILELRKQSDDDLKFLADYIYEKIFLNYTLKQWGLKPEELDPSVSNRVPVYISKDDRYFQNKYQGIPLNGYTEIFNKMLDNNLIKIQLNTEFKNIKSQVSYDRLFYTGSIDEYFDYCFGELPYRSEYFDFVTLDKDYFQSNSVINYPNNYEWTRVGEYKYFLDQKNTNNKTVISYEYPQPYKNGINERYYPIIREKNTNLYNKYLDEAKKLNNVYFLGRLGDYRYYDMDKAIVRAFEIFNNLKD